MKEKKRKGKKETTKGRKTSAELSRLMLVCLRSLLMVPVAVWEALFRCCSLGAVLPEFLASSLESQSVPAVISFGRKEKT